MLLGAGDVFSFITLYSVETWTSEIRPDKDISQLLRNYQDTDQDNERSNYLEQYNMWNFFYI